MIVNFLTVVYVLIAILALAVAVPAGVVGSRAARDWRVRSGPEERHELEKRVYLVITLMVAGLTLRLALVPLWFLALSSLVSHVPGAMCLVGVHLLDSPLSFIATALKIAVPLAYGYWLVLNALDRGAAHHRLMRLKLVLLAPLAVVVSVESLLDLRVLASVEPRSVSCCMSLFDMPQSAVAKAVSSSTSVWTWILVVSGVATMGLSYLLGHGASILRRALLAVTAAVTVVTVFLALHSNLSPILLGLPFHHCVFCALQSSVDVAVAAALVVGGCWLALVAGLLPSRVPKRTYRTTLARLLATAIALLGCGMSMLVFRVVFESIR